MGRGTWQRETKAGYTYDILYQEEESDCGPCCCAMVINLLGHGKPYSTNIQGVMKGAYEKSTRDRTNMVATPLVGLSQRPEFHSPGTEIKALSNALKQFHVPNTAHEYGSNLATAIQSATKKRPLILLVEWSDTGTGHWVVIAETKGRAQIILDPAYGLHFNYSTTNYGGLKKGASRRRPDAGIVSKVVSVEYGTWQPHWLQVD